MPEIGIYVYYPRITTSGVYTDAIRWDNTAGDNRMLEQGLICETKAEAEQKVEEIKKILGE